MSLAVDFCYYYSDDEEKSLLASVYVCIGVFSSVPLLLLYELTDQFNVKILCI